MLVGELRKMSLVKMFASSSLSSGRLKNQKRRTPTTQSGIFFRRIPTQSGIGRIPTHGYPHMRRIPTQSGMGSSAFARAGAGGPASQ